MIVHHPVNFYPLKNPLKLLTFNKRTVSEKTLITINSVVYPVKIESNLFLN